MKWATLFMLFAGVVCLATLGCGENKKIKIDNIDRVFMHDTCTFSFLENGKIKAYQCPDVSFVYDAKKKIWADADYRFYGNQYQQCDKMVIHLHAPQEINGSGWNHGKAGRGQTEVIE